MGQNKIPEDQPWRILRRRDMVLKLGQRLHSYGLYNAYQLGSRVALVCNLRYYPDLNPFPSKRGGSNSNAANKAFKRGFKYNEYIPNK